MTTPEQELEALLHDQIPISRALGVRVLVASPLGVTLGAPLPANANHKGTVFGGSAASIAFLAAWSWLHVKLQPVCPATVVIQSSEMRFDKPIDDDFLAICEGADLDAFNRSLLRRGTARVELTVQLHCRGQVVADMKGAFVAKRNS